MNPPSRDELAGSLPPPVDGEPQELRRRIAAEIADHLACASARESTEGADAEQTTRRVLSRFGDPVSVARKLWWDAVKEKIVMNRITTFLSAASLLLVGVALWQIHLINGRIEHSQQQTISTMRDLLTSGAGSRDAEVLKSLTASLEAELARNAETRELLQGVRQELSEVERAPSEFSPVRISVENESGELVEGVEVVLHLSRGTERSIHVAGTSGADGVAITRNIPFGTYQISITEPSGWSTLESLYIEIDKQSDIVVRVPDRKTEGVLVVNSNLTTEAFDGLVFGGFTRTGGFGGYTSDHSPEPGDSRSEVEDFPILRDGIAMPAVRFRFEVTRDVQQPGTGTGAWTWTHLDGESTALGWFVMADGSFRRLVDSEYLRRLPSQRDEFFSSLDLGDQRLLGMWLAKTEAIGSHELRLPVPTGQVTIVVEGFYGRPTEEVAALLRAPSDRLPEIWLSANLDAESTWVPRILNLELWDRGARSVPWLARKTDVVKQDETTNVTIGSPRT